MVSCSAGWKSCDGLNIGAFLTHFVVWFLVDFFFSWNETWHRIIQSMQKCSCYFFHFDLNLFHIVSSFAMCCVEDGVEGKMLFCQVEIVAETP